MSHKRERAIKSMVADAGATCHAITLRGSGHYMAEVAKSDGAIKSFFFSNSPSDHRGYLNKRALVRRWAAA